MEIINQNCASHFEKYCWNRVLKINSPKLCFGNLRRKNYAQYIFKSA